MVPARLNRDTTGPIARTVMDAARLFEAMIGHDPKDNITTLLLQVRIPFDTWHSRLVSYCRVPLECEDR